MSEWRVFKLGDLSKRITSGGTPSTKRPDYYGGRIPWLKTQEINFNRIYRTETYISEEGLKASSAKWIDENSIIVAMYGATAGRIAINKIPITTNQACCNITINEKLAEYEFIYYNLLNRFSELQDLANGAAQQNLNAGIISNLNILLPPLSEQKAIAHILGSLDDKIELNRRMNETLEAMARAIFKDWFVDFGPTRAKIEGRAPYLPEPIWSLFPDAIDPQSGLPQGWKLVRIRDICSAIYSGGTPSTKNPENWGGDVPWLSSGETRNTFIIDTDRKITDVGVKSSSTKKVPALATVIASAGQGNTRGQTSLLGIETYINQSVVALVADNDAISPYFLFFDLERRYDEFRRISDAHSSRGSLTTKLLAELQSNLPHHKLIQSFDSMCRSTIQKCFANLRESRTLAELRDRLLPKLMSGEIRVKDAEKLVEEVL